MSPFCYQRIPFFLLLFVLNASSVLGQVVLKGSVVDEADKPIPFVRIGIIDSRVALMSEFDGSFELEIPQSLVTERLTFQVPGYRTSSVSIDSLRQTTDLKIRLPEDIRVLNKVTIMNKRLRTKIIGNQGKRKGSDSDKDIQGDVNMAFGIMEKGRKGPYRLTKISVYINNPHPESYYLRPLILKYDQKAEMPGESLVTDNLYFEVGQMNGWFTMDLETYDIVAEGPVVLGVEYLGSTKDPAYFAISYNFGGGRNFKRVNTSDGFKATGKNQWFPYNQHRKRQLITAEIEY